MSDVYSLTQTAEELGVTTRTLRRWLVDGSLNASKLGPGRTTAWVVTRDEIERIKRERGLPRERCETCGAGGVR